MFALEEALVLETEDAEVCDKLGIERLQESVTKERIYRWLLKRFFSD
jgi:hypothetical protein